MKMLMFVELSEASSLYLTCIAGKGICRIRVSEAAPKSCRFSLNFRSDVTSCCCAMVPMNTCFLSPRWCRRAALFPPKIVCLVQMLQFRTAISHSVTRNLGRTSWGTESQSAENTLPGSIKSSTPSTCPPIFARVNSGCWNQMFSFVDDSQDKNCNFSANFLIPTSCSVLLAAPVSRKQELG